ncbi:MAG TPA: hypothetical protein VMU54_07920 [Planctomycetota bacterium]|nr:hypothetical protein [Planctomycetota bacterium]
MGRSLAFVRAGLQGQARASCRVPQGHPVRLCNRPLAQADVAAPVAVSPAEIGPPGFRLAQGALG